MGRGGRDGRLSCRFERRPRSGQARDDRETTARSAVLKRAETDSAPAVHHNQSRVASSCREARARGGLPLLELGRIANVPILRARRLVVLRQGRVGAERKLQLLGRSRTAGNRHSQARRGRSIKEAEVGHERANSI